MTHSQAVGGQRTLPLSVENMGFLLDRFGEDCGPLQFLRELTQNSIEAILRTQAREGEIVWDVDWNRFDLLGDGVFKLSIIDQGDGMTGPEMVRYINNLSASIQGQSLMGNYGVGAKIAAATRRRSPATTNGAQGGVPAGAVDVGSTVSGAVDQRFESSRAHH